MAHKAFPICCWRFSIYVFSLTPPFFIWVYLLTMHDAHGMSDVLLSFFDFFWFNPFFLAQPPFFFLDYSCCRCMARNCYRGLEIAVLSCGILSRLKIDLQCVAVCCSVLQCVAECCTVLQCLALRCSALQSVAVNLACSNSTWQQRIQCVAAYYKVLHSVAVCCIVLQVCVASMLYVGCTDRSF